MQETNGNSNITLDFDQAKAKHLLFKSKLRSILYGAKLTDEAPVLSHFECTVGKWIYNHALKAYGHIPEMQELEKVHADIHTSARELVALYKDGKEEEARKGLTGMEKIADHLVGLLAIVEHKITIEPPRTSIQYEGLEASRTELNDLLLANDALDKKIQQQSGELINERQVLHNFFMQAPASFGILKGPQHILELANEGYLQLVGKRNIIGKTVREALPEIDGQGFFELLDNVYKTGKSFVGTEMSLNIKDENGKLQQVYVNFIYQAFKNLKGVIEGILVFAYDVTEQVTARKKVEESEYRFRTLTQSLPQLIWTANTEGIVDFFNTQWYQYTGSTPEESLGNGWTQYIHPQYTDALLAKWQYSLKTSESFIFEFQLRDKEGSYQWFYVTGNPGKDESGAIINWMGTLTNIDQKKKTEETLNYRKALLEAQNEAIPDAILIVDTKGNMLSFNRHFVELWKIPEEIMQRKDDAAALQFAMTQLKDPQQFFDRVNYCYAHPAEAAYEEVLFKDGRIIERYGNAVTGEDGISYGWAWYFRDITESRKNEIEIKHSEERFRTLANSVSHLAWMANPDGWIYWYNQRWYDYTDTTLEEMQGWGWEKVHHPDHIKRIIEYVKLAWQNDEPYEMTFPLRRYDGVYRWFLTRVYPVKNNEGKVIQWIGTNTDIDDQKKALEQKDEFLSIASHELKTPVTSLKGFTQILQMKFEKEGNVQAVDLLSKMDKQVNKLTSLIVNLLDVTKIENGQLAFSEVDFDFNILIKEIAEEMQLTTESHKIVYDISDTIVVNGDRNRIGQVITNLISNAIKYSPDANEIILSTSIENQHIKLCVTDFGIGIPHEKRSNIFNRFYRVSGDKENTFPGLGLGLFISAEIIKRHNGKIYLESTAGKGSTFCFTLPVNVDK